LLKSIQNAKSIVSVCETTDHPYFCNTLPEDLNMKQFLRPGFGEKNRQELPPFYKLNGAVYVAYWEYLKSKKSFFGEHTFAYIMPQERSIDIDSEMDLQYAEFLIQGSK